MATVFFEDEVYLGILNSFNLAEFTPQLLGFKFSAYAQVGEPAPRSLYKVAAYLIGVGHVRLEDIWVHLAPRTEKDLVAAHRARTRQMTKVARSFKMSSQQEGLPPDQREEQVTDMSAASPFEPAFGELNSKIGLLALLLELGFWKSGAALLQMFMKMGITPSHDNRVAAALRSLLHRVISAPYAKHVLSGFPPVFGEEKAARDLEKALKKGDSVEPALQVAPDLSNFPAVVLTITQYLGVRLMVNNPRNKAGDGTDSSDGLVVYTKLLRLCRKFMELNGKSIKEEDVPGTPAESRSSTRRRRGGDDLTFPRNHPQYQSLLALLSQFLVPTLSMTTANRGAATELYRVLSRLDVRDRYGLYSQWQTGSWARDPLFLLENTKAMKRCMFIMNRLTAKSDQKLLCALAREALSCPLRVCAALIEQCEVSPIATVIECLSHMPPLVIDVLSYLIVAKMATGAPRLKSDGVTVADWLQAMAKFCAALYHKYPKTDFTMLLHFLSSQLRANHSVDLTILQHMIESMSGVIDDSRLSDEQLQCAAGGPVLRRLCEVRGVDKAKRVSRTASDALRRALVSTKLGIPLLVLIAQQKSILAFRAKTKHLQFLFNTHDMAQATFWQLTRFLQETASSPGRYLEALGVPTLKELREDFTLDAVHSFHISRPLLEAATKLPTDKRFSPWNVEAQEVTTVIDAALTEAEWASFSKELYERFWALTMCVQQVLSRLHLGEFT